MGAIGLTGTKAKNSKGEMGEGYTLSIGGSQGENPQIGEVHQKAIPAEDIQKVLRQVLIEQFGAKPRG
jgi:ferredoxin-nitrite reductase